MLVRNRIAECDDGKRRGYVGDKPTLQIVHRISFDKDNGGEYRGRKAFPDVAAVPDAVLTGPDVAERFKDTRPAPDGFPKWTARPGTYTGGQMPYAGVIRTGGSVDQCLAFDDSGPHAQRWSRRGLGFAYVGDFQRRAPSDAQWRTAVELHALLWAFGLGAPQGHTELEGGSSDPKKECPGALFDMGALRAQAGAHTLRTLNEVQAAAALRLIGFVL